ncbi:MAG: thiamine-phosphate kinase [Myxococcota bacterium]
MSASLSVQRQVSTVGEVGEHGLTDYLKRRLGRSTPGIVVGVGDDAAVLTELAPQAVVSADTLVEHEDFDFQYTTWEDVGHKAAAVNLSDLAAMGAEPRGLLLSVALRGTDMFREFVELIDGFVELGRKYDTPLVGGDISRIDGPVVVSVTALGAIASGRAMRRYFGRVGDVLMVSGTFGGSAAGMQLLQQGRRRPPALIKRHLRPQPQLRLAAAVAGLEGVHACADASDGLARDIALLPRPGLGVRIDVNKIPIAQEVRAFAQEVGRPAWELALVGGEDFELVFAVDPAVVDDLRAIGSEHRVRMTAVGEIVEEPGLDLLGAPEGYNVRGYDHFR